MSNQVALSEAEKLGGQVSAEGRRRQARDTKTLPWCPSAQSATSPSHTKPQHPSGSHARPYHISTISAVLVLVRCFLNSEVPLIKCSRQLYPRMVASGWVSREKWTETHGVLGIMFLSTVL